MDFRSLLSLVYLAFPNFTDRALQALVAARNEAVARRHRYVTPEHLLLALTTTQRGPGRIALERLGVDLGQAAPQLEALLPLPEETPMAAHPSFDPAIERLLTEAKAESAGLMHNYIGTEHLVLALIRCGACPAANYLRQRGVTAEAVRAEVLKVLNG